MKRRFVKVYLIFFALVSFCAVEHFAQKPRLSPELEREREVTAEIMKVEAERVQAILARDSGTIERLFAENYVQVTSVGEIRNRNHIINGLRSNVLRYDSIENSDHRFSIHGDTVVVTGMARRKGREKDRDLSGEFRFMRVWVKENGRWKLLSQQSTPLPKSGSR